MNFVVMLVLCVLGPVAAVVGFVLGYDFYYRTYNKTMRR